ncbi:MAG: hypothetical protein DRP42_00655 [Tenericutes bacterium]|nr:MAG: hypothetical protein DRP42_00655 [Mycoplasmatota bacterium]
MDKLLTYPGYDQAGPHIFSLDDDPDRVVGHVKMARSRALPPDVEHYIKTAKPIPNKTQVLIDALGSSEYWGCFPAGTLIQTSHGEVPIEKVEPGAMVLTHLNRYRPVRKLLPQATEELCDLFVAGLPSTTPALTATPNHELWVVLRDDFIRTKRRFIWKGDTSTPLVERRRLAMQELPFSWVPISDLRAGDMVAEPFPQDEDPLALGDEKWNTPEVAFLMGLYAAEGCISRRYDREDDHNPHRVVYVTGAHETDTHRRAVECANALGHSMSPQSPRDNATRMELCSKEFAKLCIEHVGTPAVEKRLSLAILRMPRGWQKAFFDAYADGDGCVRKDGKEAGAVRCVSASPGLLTDFRLLLARQGVAASIGGRHNTKATWYSGKPIFELSVSASQLGGRGIAKRYIHPDGYILSSVKKTETYGWSGEVFDLSVEEDTSYVASGLSVHNSNVNGDWFPEKALANESDTHGYRTFMRYGHPFKHHVNKDPARAYGDRVTLSSYASDMHRVLLIVSLHDNKCFDILNDLANGVYWDVSMGCFLAGTMVTMEDGTRRPIEDINEGDMVLTHRGRARRVTSTHRRNYKGELYSLRGEAHSTIRTTRQHPFLACESSTLVKNQGAQQRRWKESPDVKPDWVHAECLDDHMLFEPVIGEVLTPDYVSKAFARLLGYYIAEGHVLRNKEKEIVGIELSCHVDDVVHDEIDRLCEEFGTRNAPTTAPHSMSELGCRISIFDPRLAKLCFEHGGAYAKQKRFSSEAMRWHPDTQREIIGAFANGDGTGHKLGSLGLSTSSTDLAFQLVTMLHRCGIIPSVNNLEHKAGTGFSRRATNEWVIHIGKQWAQTLHDVTAKVRRVEILKAKKSRQFVKNLQTGDTLLATPIRDLDAIYAETEVFNLEVEEDESYLVDGLAVHNCRVPWDECSICKNHAKNRAQYCSHLKYQMNKILSDGRRVCAYNWLPKFFDISFVLIGAEKASHLLKKVAHTSRPFEIRSSTEEWNRHVEGIVKTGAATKTGRADKKAAITKRVPSNIPASEGTVRPLDDEKQLIVKRLLEDSSNIKERETELSVAAQEHLARYPLKSVFSTLAAMGIILRPEEFQRIVLVKLGHRKLAEKLAEKRLVFDENDIGPAPGWARDFGTFDAGMMTEKLALAIRPYMADRSVYPEILAHRLARFDKEADEMTYERNSPWWPMDKGEMRASSGMSGAVPASVALASAYFAYKNVLPALLGKKGFPEALKRIWLLPLLVGAGVGASVGVSTMLANRPMGEYEKVSSVDAIGEPKYHTQKAAMVDSTLMRLGVPAAVYAYAGIRRKQAQGGRRLGSLDRAIVLNPGWASLIGFGLTPNVVKSIKTLSKHASLPGDLGLYALGSPGRFMPGVLAAGLLDSLIFRGIARLASRGKRESHGKYTR